MKLIRLALFVVLAGSLISSCGGGNSKEGSSSESESTQSEASSIKEEAVPDIAATAFKTDDFSAKVPEGWVEKLNMFGMVMYAPAEKEACYRSANFQMFNPMDGKDNEEIGKTSIQDHLKQLEADAETSHDEVSDKGITRFGENEAAFIVTLIPSEEGSAPGVISQYIVKKGELTLQLLFSCSEECWAEFGPVTKFMAKSVQFN